ncbi:MAG: hypothetical protein JWQ03_3117 [Variovorax sp.]|nr:hypothetical protein [Variovorax sp.]
MAETADDTDIGYGMLLKKETAPGVYGTTLAEVTELNPPEFSRDSVQFTHMSSPDRHHEYKPGMTDAGEVSIVYNLIPGEADDEVIATHFATHSVENWRVEFANGATLDFRGFATSHGRAAPLEDRMTGSATFKVSGKPVLVPAA